jgi:hypothetical protein
MQTKPKIKRIQFFFSFNGHCQFSTFFIFFIFIFIFIFYFFFLSLLRSTTPRADVITSKAAQVKVSGLNSGSRVKPWHGYPLSEPAPASASRSFW